MFIIDQHNSIKFLFIFRLQPKILRLRSKKFNVIKIIYLFHCFRDVLILKKKYNH